MIFLFVISLNRNHFAALANAHARSCKSRIYIEKQSQLKKILFFIQGSLPEQWGNCIAVIFHR